MSHAHCDQRGGLCLSQTPGTQADGGATVSGGQHLHTCISVTVTGDMGWEN